MIEFVLLASALVAGVLLGLIFFGGLWWTVTRGLSSDQPAFWFFGSLLVRMSIALTGFYFVGRDHWDRWVLCLVGFVVARVFVHWLTQKLAEHSSIRDSEANYAP